MTTEFDKLLKEVNKLNSIDGEQCMVCHFPDLETNLIKLKCNHFYHETCIIKLIKNNKIKCPYCDKISTIKEQNRDNICKVIMKSGINKGKECNRPNCTYHKINIQVVDNNLIKCQSIIKSGTRKGELCNRVNCKYHNKSINV